MGLLGHPDENSWHEPTDPFCHRKKGPLELSQELLYKMPHKSSYQTVSDQQVAGVSRCKTLLWQAENFFVSYSPKFTMKLFLQCRSAIGTIIQVTVDWKHASLKSVWVFFKNRRKLYYTVSVGRICWKCRPLVGQKQNTPSGLVQVQSNWQVLSCDSRLMCASSCIGYFHRIRNFFTTEPWSRRV